MSEKAQIETNIARQVDRLRELNESASHNLQAIIGTPERLTVTQLLHLNAFAQELIDALESEEKLQAARS
ncbi:hypothetical protein [Methylorubrum zatmanii]